MIANRTYERVWSQEKNTSHHHKAVNLCQYSPTRTSGARAVREHKIHPARFVPESTPYRHVSVYSRIVFRGHWPSLALFTRSGQKGSTSCESPIISCTFFLRKHRQIGFKLYRIKARCWSQCRVRNYLRLVAMAVCQTSSPHLYYWATPFLSSEHVILILESPWS